MYIVDSDLETFAFELEVLDSQLNLTDFIQWFLHSADIVNDKLLDVQANRVVSSYRCIFSPSLTSFLLGIISVKANLFGSSWILPDSDIPP